ncbi:MAG: hypothetical protein Q8P25_05040 [Candidatus Curtissbacteria bacterium]|nr:hypothetical protein [Candidatus Curtissbacteria bacterium]
MAARTRGETFTPAQIASLAREIATYLPRTAVASLAAGKKRFDSRASRKKKYINPIIVDTSVLVDGRLLDIAATGFIFGTLFILPSVVSELHALSDSSDDLKRARGRRGLDILKALKGEKKLKVEIPKIEPREEAVDDKLVAFAKKVGGQVMTMDFNLGKVADVKGVGVLNLNELINALKTAVLPHEVLEVGVMSRGKGKNQGVAYLPDGTMVVVEEGAGFIGKTIKVVVLRVIQTNAGKMIFAKIAISH